MDSIVVSLLLEKAATHLGCLVYEWWGSKLPKVGGKKGKQLEEEEEEEEEERRRLAAAQPSRVSFFALFSYCTPLLAKGGSWPWG
jgi:hypothetical protein